MEKAVRNPNLSRTSKVLARIVGGVALTGVVAYGGVGYYGSSEMLQVTPQEVEYDQAVVGVNGNAYTIQGGAYDINGLMGGIRPDGTTIGIFGPPANLNPGAKTSTRSLQETHGEPPRVNQSLSLQGNIWTTNPKEALGLDYSEIRYDGPLGDMGAWMVPAKDSDQWTIAVHGDGAPLSELLRFIKPIHDAGNNVLAINYRNDVNNPASPDGYKHLGDTEWEDLQAAVRHVRQRGATVVNLFGVSIGGSIVENYLRRAPGEETSNIGRVALDSPVLDWNQFVAHRVESSGFPGFLAQPGKLFAGWRAGIDLERLSTPPGSIRHETLIIHNSDDRTVPSGPSVEVARTQPNLVTYYDFPGGGHTRAWNNNPQRYEQIVTDFLH
jgi:pimeloyl-ACP methyl ester carboxylesterase